MWNAAIQRALEKRAKSDQVEALDLLAEKLLARCDEGEISALKELGDRLDGKPNQTVDMNASIRSWSEVLNNIPKSDP